MTSAPPHQRGQIRLKRMRSEERCFPSPLQHSGATKKGMPAAGQLLPTLQARHERANQRRKRELTNLPTNQCSLTEALIQTAAERATEILSAPASAARLRQLGSDGLSKIQRLERSPLAEDQFVAVGLRLAGSRAMRGDIARLLGTYLETPSSSLEVEAQRRSIWKMNRVDQLPLEQAEIATKRIEQGVLCRHEDVADVLSDWAALYVDLWCDPRLGADATARRTMLTMVSLLHERSVSARSSMADDPGRQE